jgi:hypothetical protein
LIELEDIPESAFRVYYSGWDRSGTGPGGAVGIHHPNGDEKAISFSTTPLATIPPYDWNDLFGSSGNRLITPDPINGPLLADVFVADAATPDQSYFQSNKDIQPIKSGAQHWACDPINNPLNKDDLLNAYAALVQVPANAPDNAGDQVLYLGSERDSNNGTSFAGFWLLKDKSVGCSGTNNFSGQHTDGDILIVSDYTNGGGTQDVSVYKWVGDDATGGPVLDASFNGSICGPTLTNDDACAIANGGAITTPWSPTLHPAETFVETGIDLTTLLGSNGGCFTNFLAETRSSDVLTATLKDFASGDTWAALVWSGDLASSGGENDRFVYPAEGSNIATDNMMIPKGAQHKYTAELMMDFVYDVTRAARLANFIYYISPVKGVSQAIKKLDPDLATNPLLFPPPEVVAKQHPQPVWDDTTEATINQQFAEVSGRG